MKGKVIRVSQKFLTGHPKVGQPTHFVELILNWYWENNDPIGGNVEDMIFLLNPTKDPVMLREFVSKLDPDIKGWKSHTIRGGSRFKAGDMASLRVWSGRPYWSTDIIILPDIKIPKVWEFKKEGEQFIMPKATAVTHLEMIANNDGLLMEDFESWFNKPFDGQIICWAEGMEY